MKIKKIPGLYTHPSGYTFTDGYGLYDGDKLIAFDATIEGLASFSPEAAQEYVNNEEQKP